MDFRKELLSSDGCRRSFRKAVLDIYDTKGISLILLEPGVFDHGVKRFGKKKDGYAVVYDYDKTAKALAKDYLKTNEGVDGYSIEDAYTDAYEWLDFNTIRSIPYMEGAGGVPPMVVYVDDDGKEHVA
jgi:hypothetical protein